MRHQLDLWIFPLSKQIMGINNLLPHLPGGSKSEYLHSFYDLEPPNSVVAIDAAGALFNCAIKHASDYLQGNHIPALIEWARFLNYLRSICRWRIKVFFDGAENPHKFYENRRRQTRRSEAASFGNLPGQIRNSPEYLSKAQHVCSFFNIASSFAAYEADPQAVAFAFAHSSTCVTGDSDLLAYGHDDSPPTKEIIIVQNWLHDYFRIIRLSADVVEGRYPMFDLYRKHGRIVFQLYAGCSGCDFTELPNGLPGIGYAKFIKLASSIGNDQLTTNNLASGI